MILELPYPPSVNRAYRAVGGRVLLSGVGRRYKATVAALCRQQGARPLLGRLRMTVRASAPDRRRRDLGNLDKLLADALEGYAYDDDSQIDHLEYIRLEPSKPGFVNVTIEEIQPPADGAVLAGP